MGRGTGDEQAAGAAPRREDVQAEHGEERAGAPPEDFARREQAAATLGASIPEIEIEFDEQGNSAGPMYMNEERLLGFDILRNTLVSGDRAVLFHGPAEARAERMIEQTAAIRGAGLVDLIASADGGTTISQAGEQAELGLVPAQSAALVKALEHDCVIRLDFGSELEPNSDGFRLLARGLREGGLEIDGQPVAVHPEAVLMGHAVRVGPTLPGASAALFDEMAPIRQGQHDASEETLALATEPSGAKERVRVADRAWKSLNPGWREALEQEFEVVTFNAPKGMDVRDAVSVSDLMQRMAAKQQKIETAVERPRFNAGRRGRGDRRARQRAAPAVGRRVPGALEAEARSRRALAACRAAHPLVRGGRRGCCAVPDRPP